MKRLYILACAALMTSSVYAQKTGVVEEVLPKDRDARVENTNLHTTISGEREAFYTNDFSNPADWLIQNTSAVPGVSGFVTDLDFEIGTGLMPEGAAAIDPIASTTYDNGIAMVDSDEYGGEEGGTGIENCWFQSVNPIDCSEQETVALSFETYYYMWDNGSSDGNEYCLVEVSLDGTTWPDVETFEVADADPGTRYELWPDMETQDNVNNPTTIIFNMTDIAAGEETVYLRFRWKGTWGYAWMVDDIAMQDVPDNSLAIASSTYSDPATAMVDEYGTYTPEQQATLAFRTDVSNTGAADQLGVTMTVLVNGVEVGTSDPTDILVGETDSLLVDGYAVPSDEGIYEVTYEINGPNEDFDPSDNVAQQSFQVDEWQFGRDRDIIDFLQPTADFADGEWRAGPIYEIFQDNTVYALDVALWSWDDFQPGGSMTAFIMDPAAEGIDEEDVWAQSEEITVPDENLNTIDDEGALIWTTMVLEDPYSVFAGDEIHATVGGFNTDFRIVGEETEIPGGGLTYESGAWTNFVNVNWAVRLNFNPDAELVVNQEEIEAENFTIGQNFPNPAIDVTRINYTLEEAAEVNFEVFDITGKVIMNDYQGNLPAGNHFLEVNVSDLASGMYQYSVTVDGMRVTRPMMVK